MGSIVECSAYEKQIKQFGLPKLISELPALRAKFDLTGFTYGKADISYGFFSVTEVPALVFRVHVGRHSFLWSANIADEHLWNAIDRWKKAGKIVFALEKSDSSVFLIAGSFEETPALQQMREFINEGAQHTAAYQVGAQIAYTNGELEGIALGGLPARTKAQVCLVETPVTKNLPSENLSSDVPLVQAPHMPPSANREASAKANARPFRPSGRLVNAKDHVVPGTDVPSMPALLGRFNLDGVDLSSGTLQPVVLPICEGGMLMLMLTLKKDNRAFVWAANAADPVVKDALRYWYQNKTYAVLLQDESGENGTLMVGDIWNDTYWRAAMPWLESSVHNAETLSTYVGSATKAYCSGWLHSNLGVIENLQICLLETEETPVIPLDLNSGFMTEEQGLEAINQYLKQTNAAGSAAVYH